MAPAKSSRCKRRLHTTLDCRPSAAATAFSSAVPSVRHRARRRSSRQASCPSSPRCANDVGGAPIGGQQVLRRPRVARNACSASTRASRRTRSSSSPSGEHRVDQVVPHALLAQLHLQAVGEEGEQVRSRLRRRACRSRSAARTARSGRRSSFSTIDADDAQRGAAQREGIREPVGFSPIAKKPTSVSSLSASATATTTGARRAAIVRARRRVVVARWRRPRPPAASRPRA